MSEMSCHPQVFREPFAATDCWRKENDADDAVRRAFARVRCWRIPPHWSTQDWLDEVRAILQSAAASARFDYDKERAVPLSAHIYIRAVAAAWTRYRQEWSYYLHYATESGAGVEPIALPFDRSHADETIRYFLGQALRHLPVEDQLLIERLFWNGTRQDRLAMMLGVSQQEVSRRKVRVLQLLRQALNSYAALLLSQLGSVCLAILDDLDVILDLDLDLFW
jgi:DNA-directed RNA polymerase specialized sigma24 family protein